MTYPINYDSRSPGTPYVRVPEFTVYWPPLGGNDLPTAVIKQEWATKDIYGSVAILKMQAPTLEPTLNPADNTLIPLVDNDSGLPMSPATCQQLGALIASGHVTQGAGFAIVMSLIRSMQPAAVQGGE